MYPHAVGSSSPIGHLASRMSNLGNQVARSSVLPAERGKAERPSATTPKDKA